MRDGGKLPQELAQRMAALQVVDQILERHSGAAKTRGSAHDIRVADNYGLRHRSPLYRWLQPGGLEASSPLEATVSQKVWEAQGDLGTRHGNLMRHVDRVADMDVSFFKISRDGAEYEVLCEHSGRLAALLDSAQPGPAGRICSLPRRPPRCGLQSFLRGPSRLCAQTASVGRGRYQSGGGSS